MRTSDTRRTRSAAPRRILRRSVSLLLGSRSPGSLLLAAVREPYRCWRLATKAPGPMARCFAAACAEVRQPPLATWPRSESACFREVRRTSISASYFEGHRVDCFVMHVLRARVKDGRLELEDRVDLPDGTEVDVALLAADDDAALSDEEHAALEASIRRGLSDARAGRLVTADAFLSDLESPQ